MTTSTSTPAPDDVYLDERGRYLRVDRIIDGGRAECTVVAKLVGARVAPAGNSTAISLKRLAAMTKVDAAPALSGPDHGRIMIDRDLRAIVIDGHPIPYSVGSSGPRITKIEGGWAVGITLTTHLVGDVDLSNSTPAAPQVDDEPADSHV